MNTQESYIVFTIGSGITSRICKAGFGHVSILKRFGQQWIYISPGIKNIQYKRIGKYEAIEDLIKAREFLQYCTILCVVTRFPDEVHSAPNLGIKTCTTITRYLTGLKGFAFTPWMLYKYCTNNKIRNEIVSVNRVEV